jgi:hypothetical protein
VGRTFAFLELFVVLVSSAVAQQQPSPTPDAPRSTPSNHGAESQTRQGPTSTQKTERREGSERIFGIFPAFNVSNQTNPQPLTNDQKFKLFARGTYDPVTLVTPALKIPILQAIEGDSGFGTGFEGFAKRYGVLLADGTSSRFFRQALFPVILKEDPRYFRRGQGSFGSRLGYGMSRLFITRTDSGLSRFNWSRLLGSAASAGLSNTYYPESQRGAATTLFNFGFSYISEASANFLKEFAPDIGRKLNRKKETSPQMASPSP